MKLFCDMNSDPCDTAFILITLISNLHAFKIMINSFFLTDILKLELEATPTFFNFFFYCLQVKGS